jgi:hypothetical protein
MINDEDKQDAQDVQDVYDLYEAYMAYEDFQAIEQSGSPPKKQRVIRQRLLDDNGAGLRHLDRILRGRPQRIVNYLRMTDSCFNALCEELKAYVPHTTIFLQYVGQAVSERKFEEDFQRPRSKVHESKELVRDAIVQFIYPAYVTELQRAATVDALHEKHAPGSHPLSWPMRGGALAADGCHFAHSVRKEKANAYRNRKGYTSTNGLFACTFDEFFAFAFVGARFKL